jgi:citrate synthase
MSTDSQPPAVLSLARLATLSAHLLPSGNEQSTDHLLILHPVLAQSPLANFNGTLTIVDERTGKKYQVQVSPDGTVKATDLKKVVTLCFFMIINQSFIF